MRYELRLATFIGVAGCILAAGCRSPASVPRELKGDIRIVQERDRTTGQTYEPESFERAGDRILEAGRYDGWIWSRGIRQPVRGTYRRIWERQEDGGWKLTTVEVALPDSVFDYGRAP